MSETKLKPCPFCGGEAKFILENEHMTINCETIKSGFVMCTECDSQQGNTLKQKEAIELWNTRKPMDNIVEQLEKLDDDCGCGKISVWEAIDIVREGGVK